MSSVHTALFVSYNRTDESLVRPLVRMLRGSRATVFFDVDSTRASARWSDELETALQGSSLVLVFWCAHAKASTWMHHEYSQAISANKDVMPVLLDDTPLPTELAAYQWVDFRDLVSAAHGKIVQSHGTKRWRLWVTLLALAATSGGLAVYLSWQSSDSCLPGRACAGPIPTMFFVLILLAVVMLLAVFVQPVRAIIRRSLYWLRSKTAARRLLHTIEERIGERL